ncbi:hypothetical protein Droror1_Dr00012033 [Drosera rotundifolia]
MSSCSVPPGVRLGCQSLVEGELLVFGVRGVRLEELLLQFVRTTDSKVHWFAFGWFVTKNLARGAALVDFVWRLCAGNFTVSCVDVLVLKTVLPFCQAVKVLAFLTMPLEASSKDANQQLEFPWGLKSAVDNEHGSFGKRLEPTIRLCKKGFKG